MRFISIIIVSLFLLLANFGLADQVIKADGNIITGRIISDSPQQVTIESQGVVIDIPRSEISQIRYEEVSQPELNEARQTLEQKQYDRALTLAILVLTKYPDQAEAARVIFHQALKQLALKASNLVSEGNYEQAIQSYLFLLSKLEAEGIKTGFFTSSDEWQKEKNDISEWLARSYLFLGEGYVQQGPSFYSHAEQGFLEAEKYVPFAIPLYYTIQFELGKLQVTLGKFDEGEQRLKKVYRHSPSVNERRSADFMIKQLEARPKPTPALTPTLTPLPGRQVVVTPTPAPTPEKKEEGMFSSPKALWQKIYTKLKSKKPLEAAKELTSWIVESGVITYIIIGLIGIAVFWVAPYQFVKFRSRKGDLDAGRYLTTTKRFGLIGLFLYIFGKRKVEKPVERCPFCKESIENIESYQDFNFYVCPHCRENITPIYKLEDYIEHLAKSAERALGAFRRFASVDGTSIPEKDAMVKLIRSLVTFGVRRHASDLHIDPATEKVKVRARIDGMLYDIFNFPRGLSAPLISGIKVMSEMDISEKRAPQDGKFSLWVDDTDIDIRVNTSPTALGEKATLRLLDIRRVTVDSATLGLTGDNLVQFERCIRRPHGLILAVGPSGSGKTTTLYVAVNTINTGEKNIITIEDPVEYQIRGVSQIQVNPAINVTFPVGLRSIVRQDPDVIMVGEIRDKDTADLTVDAAITGHLVFSTLHTIDAVTCFDRLRDLGVEYRRLSQALIAIIAQRLLRLNCTKCNKPYKPKKEDLEQLGLAEAAPDIIFYRGRGCSHCLNSGYSGRTGIFEILLVDEEIRKLLEEGAPHTTIRETARRKGMRTLRDEGIIKITEGLTSVEEVVRVIT